MNKKLLVNNLKNQKITAIIVALTIALSTFFIAVGVIVVVQLAESVSQLADKTVTPDIVQMHKGTFDQEKMREFVENETDVSSYQIVKMISIDGADLEIANESQSKSVMDVSFVKQNKEMDFLLDLNNKIATLKKGEIGVPLYYRDRFGLSIGDEVVLNYDGERYSYKIVTFIRDGQMNASAVSSKRFLISDSDFNTLEHMTDHVEYLFEFVLKDFSSSSRFETNYRNENLPKKGPMVNKQTIMILGALSDGVVVLLVILISIVLIILAMITIRFTFLITLEEDLKEIGTLKAIGIPKQKIQFIYVLKYLVITIIGAILGYILSILFSGAFLNNMILYMGTVDNQLSGYFYAFLAVLIIIGIIYLFTQFVLKRIDKISSIDALKNDTLSGKTSTKLSLIKYYRFKNLAIFIGMRDVFTGFSRYILPFILFIVTSFVVLIPVNLSYTISDSSFITYLGISKSDIRIDVQSIDNLTTVYQEVMNILEQDNEVNSFAVFATYTYKIQDEEGVWVNLNTEVGDFSNFPLDYYLGKAPEQDGEIALSALAANTYQAELGSELDIMIDDTIHKMKISGVYQDITNGGKSAKATIEANEDSLLWYVFNVDLKDKRLISQKKNEWSKTFERVKITDVDDYIDQTFSGVKNQLKVVVIASIIIALMLTVLLIALFMKLKMARETRENAIHVALGINANFIKMKYVSAITSIALIGIIFGTVLANSLGEILISNIGSLFGMASLEFVIPIVISYIMLPVLLLTVSILAVIAIFYLVWRQNDLVTKIKS